MTDTTETIVIRGDGITLDLLLWRRFLVPTPGLLERTLELNRGLSDLGAFIPVGTAVIIPIDIPRQPAQQQTVRLWD
jgi:phage tail protein X